jgi:ATP-binding cassette subfamily F protein uup
VLVLDEPTNDLDIETLDLLEDLLAQYPGTVFLVSHDRRFVDNVVTSTLVAEGEGRWREYEGSVEDWLVQSKRAAALANSAAGRQADKRGASDNAPAAPAATTPAASVPQPIKANRKLSYKEQREFDELPARIAALETEQKAISERLAAPDAYAKEGSQFGVIQARHDAIDEELLTLLDRWETLSPK